MAAIYVALFHAKIYLPLWSDSASEIYREIQSRGYIGVDWFFVVSGFIMAWACVISKNDSENPIDFTVKRFFRVVPPYWIATILALYLLSMGWGMENVWKSLLFSPLQLDKPPFYGYSVFIIGWSLNYEMLFYAIFATALILPKKYVLKAVCLSIIFFVFAMPYLMGFEDLTLSTKRAIESDSAYMLMLTNTMMIEFVIGISTAIIYSKVRDKISTINSWLLLFLGLASFLYPILTYSENEHSPIKLAIPTAIFILGLSIAEHKNLIRIPKKLTWLGERSFAIYLTHLFVVVPFRDYFPAPTQPVQFYGQWMTTVFLVLLVSNYWFIFVEQYSQNLGLALVRKMNLKALKLPKIVTNQVGRDNKPLDS